MISTPGIVLHTTPYGDTSVIVKVFTRLLGVQSYIIKGVRGPHAKVKQNLLQPFSCLDMVVYDNTKAELNYIKELSPRHPSELSSSHSPSLPFTSSHSPIENALRFFMTEVLYKSLQEAEPMPALFDYAEQAAAVADSLAAANLPISFLLTVSRHLGIEPMDNYCPREPLFDIQEGRYVSAPTETTLSPRLSSLLHDYLTSVTTPQSPLSDRRLLIDALLAYYQLHITGFRHFTSHEILHTILK